LRQGRRIERDRRSNSVETKADMSDTDNKSSTVEEAGYAFQPQKLGLRPDFRLTDFTKLKG
jgi:hypothetical protein